MRRFVNEADSISLSATGIYGISDLLAELVKQYPEMRERLFSKDKSINKWINIYINDEDIRFFENPMHALVQNEDTVSIVPASAGG